MQQNKKNDPVKSAIAEAFKRALAATPKRIAPARDESDAEAAREQKQREGGLV